MSFAALHLALPIAISLLALSALFSATEVAMFSLRRVDRDQMGRSGRRVDRLVLAMLSAPRRLIATVLIGNEMVNGVFAVLVIVAVQGLMPSAPPWAVFGIAIAVVVPCVTLIGEVMPKSLGLKSPRAWSRFTGLALHGFSLVVAPVRWVIQGVSELLAKPFGASGRTRAAKDLSEEEFRTLVDAGQAQGTVDARERRLIHRVFEFADKNVGQVMTPRDKIFALSYDLPMTRLLREVSTRGFSRVRIFQMSLDNVRGVLNTKDLVRASSENLAAKTLGQLLHEPLFVPRTTPVKRLFVTFKQKKVHMAIVVNEYGKVLGLVTMDDVLEQLFGAIRDEREGVQGTRRRGRGGRTPVPGLTTGPTPRFETDELADMIGAAAPPSRPTPLSSGLDSVTSSMNAATADASGPTPLLVLDEDSGPVGQPRSARITRPPISSAAIAVPPAAPVAPTAHEDSSPITRGESS